MYSKKINKVVKNETPEQQVMRVVREMVASGELVTKKSKDGETLYSLPERKAKPRKDSASELRSESAKRAWVTIRKNNAIKEAANKRSESAKRAWVTIRKNNAKQTELKAAAVSETVSSIIARLLVRYETKLEGIKKKIAKCDTDLADWTARKAKKALRAK